MTTVGALTVVVPCYNEGAQVEVAQRALSEALEGLPEVEFLFVDDGSTDETLAFIKGLAAADPRVSYLSFTRNFGLEAAQTAGFRYARMPWCAQVDADLQAPPEEIRTLLKKAAEGYDVVFGVRRDRQDPWYRKAGSTGQQWIARRLLRIDVPKGASTFRVVRTAFARTLGDMRLGTPYFIAQVPLVGGRYALVPTTHQARTAGRSKFRLGRLAGHSFELFFGYSWRPLNLLYAMAVAGLAVAAVVILTQAFVGGGTVVSTVLALTALNLVALAVVGRYVERLLRDSGRIRPFYIREANIPIDRIDTLGTADAQVLS